ncbi:alpha/beta fold hydrolase [Mycolicibacterium sp.]|uniref:alpha/beta fold hydrolase n=1 Tax=Mycolicibacterium sp. TaxID=2320850 RepID=UPI003D148CDB
MTIGRWKIDEFTFALAPESPTSVTLVYETHGVLSKARDNVIVLPTYYTGRHDDYRPWIGPDRPFDPQRWFIVCANMFGNGVSTSPSNAHDPAPVAAVTVPDNVRAQQMLLADVFGVERVALVAGWSMGGMQAFEWAARFPDRVNAILPICATARCWPLNFAFLEGISPFLRTPPELRVQGLADFGRAYSSWAYSAEFYRTRLHRRFGVATAEDLRERWADDHRPWDPRDLLAMLAAWQRADFTDGSVSADTRLATIRAATVVMPCLDDQYFTAAEATLDCDLIPGARIEPIRSVFGHMAGRPGLVPDVTAQITRTARSLLGGPAPGDLG